MSEARLSEFLGEIAADLDRTMDFWLKHSHDDQHGGFFNCLGPKGDVYDDSKHVWLQGRQVWMYARLYNECDRFRKPEILKAAIAGGDFLLKYVKTKTTNKCALVVTRDGKHLKYQRTMFSECFYVLAMSELFRLTRDQKYKDESLLLMDTIIRWVREDGTDMNLGLSPPEGVVHISGLAVPMMLLCLIQQLTTVEPSWAEKYRETERWALDQALSHVQRDGTVILENVSMTGDPLPGTDGRLMVPGHSIEAGWFLLQNAIKTNNTDMKETAISKFILKPFEYGWDTLYGGLFYFLDVDGLSPVELTWNMKLWWTHNETMIAFLMAYKETGDVALLDKFAIVFDYCYSKHVDRAHGEWYGYLNRDGTVCMDFKGGPWKGAPLDDIVMCFNAPMVTISYRSGGRVNALHMRLFKRNAPAQHHLNVLRSQLKRQILRVDNDGYIHCQWQHQNMLIIIYNQRKITEYDLNISSMAAQPESTLIRSLNVATRTSEKTCKATGDGVM